MFRCFIFLFLRNRIIKKKETLDINTKQKEYAMANVNSKNRHYGNQVLAFYYVSWAMAMPEQVQHLGLDFGKEFELAKKIK